MFAVVPGAQPWSSVGHGDRGSLGVVVVHGFTGSAAATRRLGQRIAMQGYAVEVPLLPGHGTHHRDLARTRYGDWFAAVERIVDHLGDRCQQVALVGHSVGGTIALDLATRRPSDIAAVAVINPFIRAPVHLPARLAPLLQYVLPALPRDLIGMASDDIARPGVSEVAYARVPLKALRSVFVELPRIRSQLIDLVQPLLVVRSVEDHTVAPHNAVELLEFVASADIREVVCQRSYHVPQLDNDADEVEDAVLGLLADVTEG